MLELKEVERAQDKVARRRKILDEAIEELNEAVARAMEQANTEIISRPLKVVEIARLMDVNPSTVYRMGANHCGTYADVRHWVKVNRKDLLKTLEENYQKLLKEERK